jgi:hypothetical protein
MAMRFNIIESAVDEAIQAKNELIEMLKKGLGR